MMSAFSPAIKSSQFFTAPAVPSALSSRRYCMRTPKPLPSPKYRSICSGRQAVVQQRSRKPQRFKSATMCSSIGAPSSSAIGLGTAPWVTGASRVPLPPAKMTAFIFL